MSPPPGKKKLSLYFPDFMLKEMEAEANRLDRPLSWLIHRAWKLGYPMMVAERLAREQKKAAAASGEPNASSAPDAEERAATGR